MIMVLATVVVMIFVGCQKSQKEQGAQSKTGTEDILTACADSLLNDTLRTENIDRMLFLTDSLSSTDQLSPIKADYFRGYVHYQCDEVQPAVDYFSRVMAVKNPPAADFDTYVQAGVLLMGLYANQYDNEAALRTAMLLIDKLNVNGGERLNELKSIYTIIGRCQLRLNRPAEAEESFKKASECIKRLLSKDQASAVEIYNGFVSYSEIVTDYFNANKIVESEPWLDLAELLFSVYKTSPGANPANFEIQLNPKTWTWIGFPCSEEVEVNEAFSDFEALAGDQIKSRKQTSAWDEDEEEWAGSLNKLTPGKGFMFYSNSTEVRTLVFQTGAKK